MAADHFAPCLALLLQDEGGWVASDPGIPNGNPTFKGITLNQFRKWHQDLGVHPCITLLGPNDLRTMSDQQVAKFYWMQFWRPLSAEQLPKGVDYALFDAAVMSGQGDAVKWLQDALGVKADGKLGPLTLQAAQAADNGVIEKLCEARSDYLKHLPTFKDNPGWLVRVSQVAQAACKMLDRPVAAADDLTTGSVTPAAG